MISSALRTRGPFCEFCDPLRRAHAPTAPSGPASAPISRRSKARRRQRTTRSASRACSPSSCPTSMASSCSRPTSGTRPRTPRSCSGPPSAARASSAPTSRSRRSATRTGCSPDTGRASPPGTCGTSRSRTSAFDLVYSMGTIEHFPEYRVALEEILRVMKPGGRAVIGVPNLFDPFLRPLLVALLDRFGLYDYGLEKAFSHRGFRRLLESVGFRVLAHSGILFMPGWLRMADLWLHTRGRSARPSRPER